MCQAFNRQVQATLLSLPAVAVQPLKIPASHTKVKKPGQGYPLSCHRGTEQAARAGLHLGAQAQPVVFPRQHSSPKGNTPIHEGSFPPHTCLPKSLSEGTEDNILGLRKWPLNQFSHDIILSGCGTVRLGGSGLQPRGCSQMSCFQTGPAPKGRRGQACRGSPG